jgi:hypothetical protein
MKEGERKELEVDDPLFGGFLPQTTPLPESWRPCQSDGRAQSQRPPLLQTFKASICGMTLTE